MATRTIANGGGAWTVASMWAENAVPTAADDVVPTATSGNVTVSTNGVCRSMDLTGCDGTGRRFCELFNGDFQERRLHIYE